jgi:hypothetical protein
MFISPNLLILLVGGTLLFVGKCWAGRCYYRDIGNSCTRQGWRFDPTRDFPEGH